MIWELVQPKPDISIPIFILLLEISISWHVYYFDTELAFSKHFHSKEILWTTQINIMLFKIFLVLLRKLAYWQDLHTKSLKRNLPTSLINLKLYYQTCNRKKNLNLWKSNWFLLPFPWTLCRLPFRCQFWRIDIRFY